MNETDETFTEIELTNDKSLLYYNKSKVFKVKNKKQIGLDGEIVGKNTTLDTLTDICTELYTNIVCEKKYKEKEQLDKIFEFFELENNLIKDIYNNPSTSNEDKKKSKKWSLFIE